MTPYAKIFALLNERIGFDVSSVGTTVAVAGVRKRMRVLNLTDAGFYLDLLANSPDEAGRLIEETVVPETWFFRDQAPFKFLERWARKEAGKRPVRLLSAGCSSGEEAYSIAAVLLDAGLQAGEFSVLGVDVSAEAIARARAGLYPPRILRPRMGGRGCGRHFHCEANGTVVVKEGLKLSVRFRVANLVDPGLLADEAAFQVIFCRNVLIYQSEAARKRMFESFKRLLLPDGLLFVGHSEPLRVPRENFRPVGPHGAFVFRKGSDTSAAMPAPASRPSRRVELPAIRWETCGGKSSDSGWLAEARRLADEGRLREAAALCKRRLDTDGADAEALFLLGIIAHAGGNPEEAEALFQKTVYLNPLHQEALNQLALMAEGRDDSKSARIYRRRARRVLEMEAGA